MAVVDIGLERLFAPPAVSLALQSAAIRVTTYEPARPARVLSAASNCASVVSEPLT
jgi:hypothetical protein